MRQASRSGQHSSWAGSASVCRPCMPLSPAPPPHLFHPPRCFAQCDSQVVTQEPGAGVDDAREQCSAMLFAAGQVRRDAPPRRSRLHRRAPCRRRRRDDALTLLCVINADARRIGRARGLRTGVHGGEHAAPYRGDYQSARWHEALGAPFSLRSAQPCSPMHTQGPAKQKLTSFPLWFSRR
jgi:hypothetical protein